MIDAVTPGLALGKPPVQAHLQTTQALGRSSTCSGSDFLPEVQCSVIQRVLGFQRDELREHQREVAAHVRYSTWYPPERSLIIKLLRSTV